MMLSAMGKIKTFAGSKYLKQCNCFVKLKLFPDLTFRKVHTKMRFCAHYYQTGNLFHNVLFFVTESYIIYRWFRFLKVPKFVLTFQLEFCYFASKWVVFAVFLICPFTPNVFMFFLTMPNGFLPKMWSNSRKTHMMTLCRDRINKLRVCVLK